MNKHEPRHRRHARLSAKYRDYFATNLSMLLGAAVPVGEALRSLEETSKSRVFRRAMQQIRTDVDEGVPLWKALDASGMATGQTLALVRLGEASGRLVENLRVAAEQEEKQRQFRAKVRSALLYPGFVIGLTLIIGIGVAWFLLPRLSQTFKELHVPLPVISQVFLGIGDVLLRYGLIVVPAIIGIAGLLIFVLFIARATRWMGTSLLLHTPGVSRMLREVEIARFGYLMGTLLQAGLNITQAFDSLLMATESHAYQKFYRYLRASFEDGYSFQTSLPRYKHGAKLVPPAVQQMIIAGEKSGTLPETLQHVGNTYDKKAEISTQSVEAILEPLLLVVVWVGVLLVAVAVILPIYSLIGGLES